MTSRKYVASLAVAIASIAGGCSSSDDTAGGLDASADAKAARDASSPTGDDDSGGGGSSCSPADETSFTPKWHAANPRSSACTMAQVSAYHQCLSDQQSASCAAFGANASDADKACLACMISLDTAPAYGPLIVHNKTTFEVNVAGCIALSTNDPEGKGCAGAFQASQTCTSDACGASCTDASVSAFDTCRQAAAKGTCSAWYQKTSCVYDVIDAGSASACFAGTTFDALFDAIVPLFCVAPADAGASDASAPDATIGDASSDASAADASTADAGDASVTDASPE